MDNTENTITIADLDLLKNIVDLASSRGAFRGSELKTVGEVYDKLNTFLNAVIEQAKAQEESNLAGSTAGENKGE
jgi:hypothetical protein